LENYRKLKTGGVARGLVGEDRHTTARLTAYEHTHGGDRLQSVEAALEQRASADHEAALVEASETAAASAGEHDARPGQTLTHGGNTNRK
jgi:hypothetical protein